MPDPTLIDAVYCLNCRQPIPAGAADCPHCGAIRGTIPAPRVVAEAHRARNRRTALWATLAVVAALVGLAGFGALVWNVMERWSALARTAPQSRP